MSSLPTQIPSNGRISDWPSYDSKQIAAVTEVLASGKVNYWTGEKCRSFENSFAEYIGSAYGIAMCNGTVVLEAALKALGVGPGDEVIVSSRSFVASASCVLSVGATPVFSDVCATTQNITQATIEAVLTEKTRAIICVHLAGWPCDMEKLSGVAKSHGLYLIEDCAQAHGAAIGKRSVGTWGDVGCWSFCQDKIMTTGGEGGMVTTDSASLRNLMWSMKDHGKCPLKTNLDLHGQGDLQEQGMGTLDSVQGPGFKWVHDHPGTNWRMTEMQAVLGIVQLRLLSAWGEERRKNMGVLLAEADRCPALRVPEIPSGVRHAAYRAYGFVRPQALKSIWSRDRIIAELQQCGVGVNHGSCPEIYREKLFVDRGLAPVDALPVARQLGETSVSFLVHPGLSEQYLEHACSAIKNVMRLATR